MTDNHIPNERRLYEYKSVYTNTDNTIDDKIMENLHQQLIINGVDVSGCEYCLKMTKCRCAIQRNVYKCLCEENPNCHYKQLKRKEQECEELKKELQAQRAFTAHEQKLIYCVAYDETCKTGNDCKQKKCIFKDNIKLKQTLTEIKEIADKDFNHTCWETYARQLKQILQKISEYKGEYNEKSR